MSINTLTLVAGALTMSSHEISELVESRHDSVKRAVERCAERGAISLPPLVEVKIQRERRAESVEVYRLDKRSSLIVVAQLCPEFTARIVDRWLELEAKVAQPAIQIPTTLAGALRLAADQAEQLALAAPKVEFMDRYVESSGLKGFREVAKLLNANEARFSEFLEGERIMYRLGGKLTAYQQHINAGRFQVKTGTSQHSGHSYLETKFTAKGAEWIAGLWAVHKLREEGGA